MTGVYAILHRESGRGYIGSAKDVDSRWTAHRKRLRAGNHHSRFLQFSWNKYGAEAFNLVMLDQCAPDDLVQAEQEWIDGMQSADGVHGFNMSPRADRTGMSEDGKQRLRVLRLGTKASPETRALLSVQRTGKTPRRSQAWIDQLIARNTALAGKPGRRHTPEEIELIRQRHLGSKRSEETKEKLRAAWIQRRSRGVTAETRARMSAARKGKQFSLAHRMNIAAAIKAAHARRRGEVAWPRPS